MRNIILILFVSAALLAGCRSSPTIHTQMTAPAAVPSPPFHPAFITTPGTNTTSDGTWRIFVSPSDGSVHLTRLQELVSEGRRDAVSVTTSPDGWRAQPGWFVFVESKSRVWVYDGDRALLLQTETAGQNSHGEISGPRRFPCAVPPEVFARLSAPAQKAIETRE